MENSITSRQLFQAWKKYGGGQADHLSTQRLYQMSLDQGLENAQPWEVEHLSLCPHCIDKWEAFCLISQDGIPQEYEESGLVGWGEVKAASTGLREPVSLPSQCKRFTLGIFPDMEQPDSGMVVLEITSDAFQDYEGKKVIVKDSMGHKYMAKNKSMLRKRNCKFLTDTCQYIIQLSFQKFKSFIGRC